MLCYIFYNVCVLEVNMEKKSISLNGEKELRIFMLPLRQQIIREMRIIGKPITAKQLADKLNITPSSAKHHLNKLQEIGIVEFDHSKLINGITANYMSLTDVDIRIGQDLNDEFNELRDVYSQNIMSQVYQRYQSSIEITRPLNRDLNRGDFLTGVVHLSDDKLLELLSIMNNFIDKNKDIKESTNAYEFALVYYKANSIKNKEDNE